MVWVSTLTPARKQTWEDGKGKAWADVRPALGQVKYN